ncbi:hypothetical protein K470DRAFT_236172 [Piedraia hortae CBS 480.64]|uniref:TAFII28-like protein domain-containing protein n=1 Tax=Piedraia hortae CBS 480.64 TaxID=1314780 RepID=A0A6A7BTQ5_9PEZI|nr:hypothetical protein K470DRAFT_236172 [Piedraia hortae CBS 480.64]
MASPPPSTPTSIPSLALPRQRTGLSLPNAKAAAHVPRKPSITTASSFSHPLRQTSFPPSDASERQFSPAVGWLDEGGDDDLGSDIEVQSTISGPAGVEEVGVVGGKKKRKPGRPRGRPAKNAGTRPGSVVDDGGKAKAGQEEDGQDDDDEDDEVGETDAKGKRVPIYEGGQMTNEEMEEYKMRKNTFYLGARCDDHRERYTSYGQAKLNKNDLRRLVNQVLGQSVPGSVVMAMTSFTKAFAAQIIEDAKTVQLERLAVEPKRADGSENPAYNRLKRASERWEEAHADEPGTKKQKRSDEAGEEDAPIKDLSKDIEEQHCGPLLPDHLREALRRYKKRCGGPGGGTVGFTGLSLGGKQNTAPRTRGRRIFR